MAMKKIRKGDRVMMLIGKDKGQSGTVLDFIEGKVKKGKKLGRKLGYRTCNISIKNYILPKKGIYAVKVLISNKRKIYNGIGYLGYRPTFNGREIFLEINIFNIKRP